MNITKQCRKIGRCPKCTLVPPCKHIKATPNNVALEPLNSVGPLKVSHGLTTRHYKNDVPLLQSQYAFDGSPRRRGQNRPDIVDHYAKMNNILNSSNQRQKSSSVVLALDDSQISLLNEHEVKKDNFLGSVKGHTKTSKLRHIHSRRRFQQSLENVRFMKQE